MRDHSSKEKALIELLCKIEPPDKKAMQAARMRWNSIAKPLHSLGKLEEDIVRIAGMTGKPEVSVKKRSLIVMCADNGVVEEGVTQTGQEVTKIVAENFLTGNTSAAIMCRQADVQLFPIDIGIASETKVPDYKIRYGTGNIAKGPAMTRAEAVRAVLAGVEIVKERAEAGDELLCTGEMGIGNTTTSSAVASVLLHCPAEELTGRGAGLDETGLERKIQAVKRAVEVNEPEDNDALDVLAKVGGLDLAGLTGVYLGGAYCRIPVVIDGFISAVAALLAVRLCPTAGEYMLASHVSKEPGAKRVMAELKLSPGLHLGLCLGEGTGALSYVPVLQMACEVYRQMSTFAENEIVDYEDYPNTAEASQ